MEEVHGLPRGDVHAEDISPRVEEGGSRVARRHGGAGDEPGVVGAEGPAGVRHEAEAERRRFRRGGEEEGEGAGPGRAPGEVEGPDPLQGGHADEGHAGDGVLAHQGPLAGAAAGKGDPDGCGSAPGDRRGRQHQALPVHEEARGGDVLVGADAAQQFLEVPPRRGVVHEEAQMHGALRVHARDGGAAAVHDGAGGPVELLEGAARGGGRLLGAARGGGQQERRRGRKPAQAH